MFSAIRRVYFFSGVQADLKAQCDDQAFVEMVCQGPKGASYTNDRLDRWREITKPIHKSKIRFFIIACGVLGDRLMNKDLPPEDLNRCATLLADRCDRIMSSPEILIICQESIPLWMSLIEKNQGKSSGLRGVSTASQIIFAQLPFCDLDPVSLSAKLKGDEFALGYIFGVADMANYQFNRSHAESQGAALHYIKNVFIEILGSDGEERFVQALQCQSSSIFAQGRQAGADDLGGWLKTQGQRYALGLSRHIFKMNPIR